MADEGEELKKLVESHEDLEFKPDGSGKVRCISTGQEITAKLQQVKDYINGNKYKKSREWYSFNWAQYEPDLIQHERQTKFLFCTLTGTTLPKNPPKVKAHVESKRFKELKKSKEESGKKQEEKLEKKKELRAKLKAEHLAKLGLTGKVLAKAKARSGKPKEGEEKAGDAAKKKNNRKRKRQDKSAGSKDGEAAKDGKAEGEGANKKKNKKKNRPERSIEGRRKNVFVKKDGGASEGAAAAAAAADGGAAEKKTADPAPAAPAAAPVAAPAGEGGKKKNKKAKKA